LASLFARDVRCGFRKLPREQKICRWVEAGSIVMVSFVFNCLQLNQHLRWVGIKKQSKCGPIDQYAIPFKKGDGPEIWKNVIVNHPRGF
jgi:hypothetical protein